MHVVCPAILAAVSLLVTVNRVEAAMPRTTVPFNDNWQFHPGGEAPDLDDAGWQSVDLPHDWAIAGPFDPAADGSQGKLPWRGEGWYRKHFSAPAAAAGARMILVFDGVMANPKVYLNGQAVGGWRYGYNSFWLDVTDAAAWGEQNLLAVHASTLDHYSRWYPGAGIYRKVTLLLVGPVHVPTWGVWIKTPSVSADMAQVEVETSVTHAGAEPVTLTVQTEIIDPRGGNAAAIRTEDYTLPPGETTRFRQSVRLPSPSRWDIDHPDLYIARTSLLQGDQLLDRVDTRFGIRSIEWTADDGFHLNDRRVQLQGVCLHHDNGPLGAAEFRDAAARKLRIMKNMGVNAVRTSHNPPSPDLLELCDEMGLLVIDELFDKYGHTAGVKVPTAEFVDRYAEAEVRNFVYRDRNHPSVILWSIGNEIPDLLDNRDGQGGRHVRVMHDYFNKYDPTRLTNLACHMPVALRHDVLDAVDTIGWNYGQKYVASRARYPGKPQIYTESASAFSTRGYYAFAHPAGKGDYSPRFTESSYDRTAAAWSDIPDVEFMRMERDSYVAGEFVWTGFDYLGEPTPHTADARSSYFGIVDLAGLPKDRFYLYRAHWNKRDHTTHLLPHWSWPDRVGQNVPVYVYTDGDEAELFLNGRSLGRRAKRGEEAESPVRNLAQNRPTTASSEEIAQDDNGNVLRENRADAAVDGSGSSRWCASSDAFPQWWQVDLEQVHPVGYLRIDWERNADAVAYEVEVSSDQETWQSIGGSEVDRTYGGRSILLPTAQARFVRVQVRSVRNGWASIREVRIESTAPEGDEEQDPYYQVMDQYRLRWETVTYEPGELRAVSYAQGKQIGEAVVTTPGPAAALRLTPETGSMTADGQGLSYILVEAVDTEGRLAPHDMSRVRFTVNGPATIAGIGNGDPLCLDPFPDAEHPLFYGKAVLILRSRNRQPGAVQVQATAEGLAAGATEITAAE